MKRYMTFTLPIAAACFAGACLIGVLSLVVITLTSLAPGTELPFFYYQHLNLPILSVALPVIAMACLLPIALHMAFAREKVAGTVHEITAERGAGKAEFEAEEHRLKAA